MQMVIVVVGILVFFWLGMEEVQHDDSETL